MWETLQAYCIETTSLDERVKGRIVAINTRIDYIHTNPVKAGYVNSPEHYNYSSAANYMGQDGLIEVQIIDLGSTVVDIAATMQVYGIETIGDIFLNVKFQLDITVGC